MMNAMRWAISHGSEQRRTDLVQKARGDGEDVDRLAGSRRLQRRRVGEDLLSASEAEQALEPAQISSLHVRRSGPVDDRRARRRRRRRPTIVKQLLILHARSPREARINRRALERSDEDVRPGDSDGGAVEALGADACELEHVGAAAGADRELPDARIGLELEVAEVRHDAAELSPASRVIATHRLLVV